MNSEYLLIQRTIRNERPRISMASAVLEFFTWKYNLFTTEVWYRYYKIYVDVTLNVVHFVTVLFIILLPPF